MQFISRIQKLIASLEKERFSIFSIFWLVVIIGIVRAYVEEICFTGNISIWSLNENDIMTSLAAFFGCTFLVSIFSKERIKKVWNATILFWPIFISPPIIDYLFFGGCSRFSYEFVFLNKVDLTLLFPPLYFIQAGVSPGLVIEYIAVILALVYVYIKSHSIKRTSLFYIFLNIPGYLLVIHPLPLLANFDIVWQLKALPFAYEWYYFLFTGSSLLIFIFNRKKLKIPRKIIIFLIPLTIFYALGVFLSFYQSPKPFSQLLKFSTSFFPFLAFFLLQEPSKLKKDIAFICLSFSPFLSLYLKNIYVTTLSTILSLLVFLWYKLRKFPRIFLTILLTSSFFFGYFAYGSINPINKFFFVFPLLGVISFIITILAKP